MSSATFEVVEGGLQTTVQDSGRLGHFASGIPTSGAFDNISYRLGNLLVGNQIGPQFYKAGSRGDASLEITLIGPKLKVMRETIVAVTGGDLAPTVNGQPLPMWCAVRVAKDDIIKFGKQSLGCRAYLAVAGGIDVPPFLGSRSTYVGMGGKVGGFEGRALKKGDVIKTGISRRSIGELEWRTLRSSIIPIHLKEHLRRWNVHVVMGPQDYLVADGSVEAFLQSDWEVTPAADRAGYRYKGPQLFFKPRPEYLVKAAGSDPSNIVLDTIAVPGGIQIPGGLEAIFIGPDGPSIGGFAKIAAVITADVSLVAQGMPSDTVRFVAVTLEEAISRLRELESIISEENVEVR